MLVHNISRSDHPLHSCQFVSYPSRSHLFLSQKIILKKGLFGDSLVVKRDGEQRTEREREREMISDASSFDRWREDRTRILSLLLPRTQKKKKKLLYFVGLTGAPSRTEKTVYRPIRRGTSVKRCVFCFHPHHYHYHYHHHPWVGTRRGRGPNNDAMNETSQATFSPLYRHPRASTPCDAK